MAVLAVAVGATVVGAVIGELPDLHVYRYAGEAVLDQHAVYAADDPVTGYPFTYPPFAAVLMVPLAVVPGWAAAGLVTGVSLGCLAATIVVVRRALDRPTPWWLVVAGTGVALTLEPVWQNLSFGQVNLILMLTVLVDLLHLDRRFAGALLGIAAGIKLTPLVFVVLLVAVGRRDVARRALLVFAGTVAAGFAVLPGSASTYWTDGLLEPGRVGPPALAHNQSVTGTLARLLGDPPGPLLWIAVAGPVAVAMILTAAAVWRRGDPMLGICLGALAMLLASPVSWSHHWVWAVPVALVLWERQRWVAAGWILIFVSRPILWPPWGAGREYDWGVLDHGVGNAYVIAALALTASALQGLRRDRTPSAVGP